MKNINIIYFFLIITLCININEAMAVPHILDNIIAIVDNKLILKSDIDTLLNIIKKKILHNNCIIRRQMIHKLIMDNIHIKLAENINISDTKIDKSIINIATRHNYINFYKLHKTINYKDIKYNFFYKKIKKEILIYEVRNFFVRSSIIIFNQEIYIEKKNIFNKNLYLNLNNIFIPINYNTKNIKKAYSIILFLIKKKYEFFNIKNISISNYTHLNILKYKNNIICIKKNFPLFFYKVLKNKKTIFFSKKGFYILNILSNINEKLIIFYEIHARHIMLRSTSIIINDEKSCIILMNIAQKINNGHIIFSEAAKQLSEDQYSAPHGGDLGWKKNNFFENLLLKINKGEIGTPVQSSYGWHIIEIINTRKIDRTKKYNKKKIHKILFNRKFTQETITWLKEQRTSIYVTIFNTINKLKKHTMNNY